MWSLEGPDPRHTKSDLANGCMVCPASLLHRVPTMTGAHHDNKLPIALSTLTHECIEHYSNTQQRMGIKVYTNLTHMLLTP